MASTTRILRQRNIAWCNKLSPCRYFRYIVDVDETFVFYLLYFPFFVRILASKIAGLFITVIIITEFRAKVKMSSHGTTHKSLFFSQIRDSKYRKSGLQLCWIPSLLTSRFCAILKTVENVEYCGKGIAIMREKWEV